VCAAQLTPSSVYQQIIRFFFIKLSFVSLKPHTFVLVLSAEIHTILSAKCRDLLTNYTDCTFFSLCPASSVIIYLPFVVIWLTDRTNRRHIHTVTTDYPVYHAQHNDLCSEFFVSPDTCSWFNVSAVDGRAIARLLVCHLERKRGTLNVCSTHNKARAAVFQAIITKYPNSY